MIKQNQQFLNSINIITDIILINISYLISVLLLFGFNFESKKYFSSYSIQVALLFSLSTIVLFYLAGIYRSFRFSKIYREIFKIITIYFLVLLILLASVYFTKTLDISRRLVATFFVLSLSFIILKRILVLSFLRYLRRKGFNQKHVIISGGGEIAQKYIRNINIHPEYGIKITGYISPKITGIPSKYLGNMDALNSQLYNTDIDEVVIALDSEEIDQLIPTLKVCDVHGTRAVVMPFYQDYIPSHPTSEKVGECKLLNIKTVPLDHLGNAMTKRFMDIVASIFLLTALLPLLIIVSIGIKLSSPGPIFFVQERLGKNKKKFLMYKFRSMRINDFENIAWSQNKDPRRTWFGSIIRKLSVDELPQLFNVLKGEMSLVGPRPEIPFYVDKYRKEIDQYMMKHQVRPGLTGWAQINGWRGDTSINKRIEHDIWYINNWSITLDLKIIFKTIFGGMINQESIIIQNKLNESMPLERELEE